MTEAERAVWIAYGPAKEAALARLGLCVAWIPKPPAGSICDRLHKLPWQEAGVEPEMAERRAARGMLQACCM
jgi:hypothetical protein